MRKAGLKVALAILACLSVPRLQAAELGKAQAMADGGSAVQAEGFDNGGAHQAFVQGVPWPLAGSGSRAAPVKAFKPVASQDHQAPAAPKRADSRIESRFTAGVAGMVGGLLLGMGLLNLASGAAVTLGAMVPFVGAAVAFVLAIQIARGKIHFA